MKHRLFHAFAVALLACTGLVASGCAVQKPDPEPISPLTFPEVRTIQNEQLEEFAALIPAEQIVDRWGPIEATMGMSCDTDLGGRKPYFKEETGTRMLTGGMDLYLSDSADVPAILEQFAASKSGLDWKVAAADGTNEAQADLVLESPDGFSYYVSFLPNTLDGKNDLSFTSFGPCVIPPKDFSPHDAY
ncbi:hypothetical protein [Leucobacter chromiiresistens]|uniref:Lipoprotein n=2 Tax=Leucobacter chromiiresistens TaxID=1079994 RepID=A0A1H0YEE0_9MICO|nr:hypothetical protein [Leucobacter chromiiresistens]SDQ13410.1 hypothetical protein SAMN04488565_0788 [Leucobacter chromiiresistens]